MAIDNRSLSSEKEQGALGFFFFAFYARWRENLAAAVFSSIYFPLRDDRRRFYRRGSSLSSASSWIGAGNFQGAGKSSGYEKFKFALRLMHRICPRMRTQRRENTRESSPTTESRARSSGPCFFTFSFKFRRHSYRHPIFRNNKAVPLSPRWRRRSPPRQWYLSPR